MNVGWVPPCAFSTAAFGPSTANVSVPVAAPATVATTVCSWSTIADPVSWVSVTVGMRQVTVAVLEVASHDLAVDETP